ncbi:MAG: ABC transporter permease [Bacteroidales bacterium]|nr:ABC transporter permease [Bacteroidales bacterium]MDD2612018.1 ABC transporter permease [Bacteroidales bacterium]
MIITACRFIRYEKSKSFGILLSIIISIYLVGLVMSIFLFLANIIGGLVNNSNPEYAQVFVVNKQTDNANQLTPFDARWVNQLQSLDGVDDAHGIIYAPVSVKFSDGKTASALMIGSDYPEMAAGPSSQLIAEGSIEDLLGEGTVSTDFYDNKAFGRELKRGSVFEINGKYAIVGVTTKNAKGFSNPLIYTTTSKARYFSGVSEFVVNAVIVTVKDPDKIDAVISRINEVAPQFRAWKSKDLALTTVVNVMTANNMGMSIGTMVLFAIISGFFIIGLTLFSSTNDRIKDYGTLKAIGASGRYITRLVLTQATIYAVIGFLISWLMLVGTQIGMAKGGLNIHFSPLFLLLLFAITFIIAVGSAFFSVNKLKKVEPSSVFR